MKLPQLKFNKKFLVIALIIILAVSGIIGITLLQKPSSVSAAWYTTGGTWNYRQKLTIDATKVGTVNHTDQTDFPVLVKITDQNNPVFTKSKADGSDIIFVASDETTKLSYEIEKFSTSSNNRELDAWVKITSLSHTDNTIIYMYYGNSAATAQPAADRQDVWSNGYAGVWHMGDSAANKTVADSLGANNGTAQQNTSLITTPGQVDGSLTFNGSSDYVQLGNKLDFDYTSPFSMTAFVKRSATGGSQAILSKMLSSGTYRGWMFWLYTDKLGFVFRNTLATNYIQVSTTNTFTSTSLWYKVTVTYDGSGHVAGFKFYVNGALQSQDAPIANTLSATTITTANSNIGSRTDGAATDFSGAIDDARISTVVRTPDWIATEYANQNDSGTFFGIEAEVAGDQVAPSNPTTINGYSTSGKTVPLTTGSYYNYATPYFEWSGAGDTGNTYVSGVAGYYSYFGTTCDSDPYDSGGVLPDAGPTPGRHYSTDANITVPDLTTAEGTYCLRIKTADNADNISATASELFTYKYEVTVPNRPAFVSVNPAGYSAVDSFDFSWPTATDTENSTASGIAGYQYMRGGSSGDTWSSTISTNSIDSIASYQTGDNIFLVRSIDNAGNVSESNQTTYSYSANPPGAPTGLLVNDQETDTTDINSFHFDWTAPAHSRPIVDYGYSFNASPTINNLTWTGSDATTLVAGAYATQQGVNTFYLIAKDDSGAYSFSDSAIAVSVFNCTTVAPPIPTAVSITDSSDKIPLRYMLTLQWQAGINQDQASFHYYSIERSVDGITFSEIATSASSAYIDASSLNNATLYYYRIRAVDNAGSISAPSTIVSKTPTGNYTSAPPIVSEPVVSIKGTTATISWVVGRTSNSAVRYSTSRDDLLAGTVSPKRDPNEGTSPSVESYSLLPNTTYYYQVQSIDTNNKDYESEDAFSAIYSFTTEAAPSIANVAVSNITLTTADITWETSSASNTKVHYGTTFDYGSITPEVNDSMTTRHSVKLTKLSHTTTYNFKIMGTDINSNLLKSDNYIFKTLEMPAISAIEAATDFSGPAPVVNITWKSNVQITSSVEYTPKVEGDAVTFEESQSALVKDHRVTLSNLSNDTEYQFTVSGVDQFGNKALSDLQVLKTTADSRPPSISNIIIETSNVGSGTTNEAKMVISWQTDELSTSQIAYSPGISGTEYQKMTPDDTALVKNHIVIVSGLKPATPYHFKIITKDDANNTAESSDNTVISGQATESTMTLIARTLNNIFGWMGKISW